MRSVVKIWLGVEIIVKLVVTLLLVFFALEFLVFSFIPLDFMPNSLKTLDILEELSVNSELRSIALVSFIVAVIIGLSALIAFLTINKLDTVDKKWKLTLNIIGLFFMSSPILALLIIFTPKKYLLSQHPYFE